MTAVIVSIVVTLLIVAVLLRVARGHAIAAKSLQDLQGHTTAVDLAAFRNLVNPAEDEFLRCNLEVRDFRQVQRARARAAMWYIRSANQNAAILLRLGEVMRDSPEPELAMAGRRMAEDALRLRVYAFLALMKLYVRLMVPGARISPAPLVDRYEHLTDVFAHLIRLQQPGLATRVTATL